MKMRKPAPAPIAIIDTREQWPLDLEKYGIAVKRDTLAFGDYSLVYPDMRDEIIIERKSLADFAACCGRERERFERELIALRGFRWPYLVGEFCLRDILDHQYRSQINPNSLLSSIAKWSSWGIHFLFCDDHEGASYICAKVLIFTARREIALACAKFEPAVQQLSYDEIDISKEEIKNE